MFNPSKVLSSSSSIHPFSNLSDFAALHFVEWYGAI